uniref:Uncharacterized protein n=1 Tax=Glossina brevipalpis TaxID=37001 RepID=A0A1A9W0J8_9MUSC
MFSILSSTHHGTNNWVSDEIPGCDHLIRLFSTCVIHDPSRRTIDRSKKRHFAKSGIEGRCFTRSSSPDPAVIALYYARNKAIHLDYPEMLFSSVHIVVNSCCIQKDKDIILSRILLNDFVHFAFCANFATIFGMIII